MKLKVFCSGSGVKYPPENRYTNSPRASPCNVERRPALLVLLGGVGALVEQDGRDVGVAVERGQVQRRPAPVVRVDVDTVLEQRADCVGLAVPASTTVTCFRKEVLEREIDRATNAHLTARCRAFHPWSCASFTLAPDSISSLAFSGWPFLAAKWRQVQPFLSLWNAHNCFLMGFELF